MFHALLKIWFQFVLKWKYLGIVILMAIESTVVPVPSEIVISPAAYWASQHQMNFWGVVAAGTIGSYIGSAISYFVAQKLGRPILLRYGKYVFFPPEKLAFAQNWVSQYAFAGIFLARMLPVVRHIVSMPAGILKMPFLKFSTATILGAGFWCFVLAWFGNKVIGDQPALLQDPAILVSVLKQKLIYFVVFILVLGSLYFIIHHRIKKMQRPVKA